MEFIFMTLLPFKTTQGHRQISIKSEFYVLFGITVRSISITLKRIAKEPIV